MANNKKEVNTENTEVVEEAVTEETVVKAPAKKTTSAPKAVENNADKEKIKSLEQKIADLNEVIIKMMAREEEHKQAMPYNTDVTLVYMSDSLGIVQVPDLELRCTRFGESFTVNRTQFDMIVGKYRSWFDQGILAVDPKNIEVAAAKKIKTTDEYAISEEKLRRLGKMSVYEIENLWNSLTTDAHKLTLVQYFKRKFIEGLDGDFRDRGKVDLLNRLTDGGLMREAQEVSGQSLKIHPIEM